MAESPGDSLKCSNYVRRRKIVTSPSRSVTLPNRKQKEINPTRENGFPNKRNDDEEGRNGWNETCSDGTVRFMSSKVGITQTMSDNNYTYL